MEIYWQEEELKFKVHLKENQLLKYLNKGSTHTNATFHSIPSGVLRRLSSLTSATPENENKRLNLLYPGHTEALERAELIHRSYKYPTLREMHEKIQQQEQPAEPTEEDIAASAKKDREKARTIWFCIGYSKIWGTPISKRLKTIRDKYNLPWLRNSMSYHKFTNLGEMFNGDLSGKVMKDIKDFNL